jgi:hypothetical protein
MCAIIEADACIPPASWLHGSMLRLTAAALLVLSLITGCSGDRDPHFALVVNATGDPARAWVVSGAFQGIPVRPAWSDDWSEWTVKAGATPLSARTILLSVQGEVSVTAVRVKVVQRRPAIAGTQFVVVGGDPAADQRLEFDLDGQSMGREAKAGDGETLAVTVQTQRCDCDWFVELDWSGAGHSGTRTIDNERKPFRVSASTATVGRCVTYPDRTEKCESF